MPDPEVKTASRQNRPRSALAIVLGVLVVLGAVGFYFWMRPARLSGGDGSSVVYTLPLEPLVVNLSGNERAYLRMGVALGLSRTPAHKEDVPVAMVRDTILAILSAVKPGDVTGAEGKDKLKAEILQTLKERAPQLGVEDVYFTEFLVQQ